MPFAYQPVAYIAPNSLPQFNRQPNFATPQFQPFKPFPNLELFPQRNLLQRNVDFLQRYAPTLNDVLQDLQHILVSSPFPPFPFPNEERPLWPSFGHGAVPPPPPFPLPRPIGHWPMPTIKPPVIEVSHDADLPSTSKPVNAPSDVQPAVQSPPQLQEPQEPQEPQESQEPQQPLQEPPQSPLKPTNASPSLIHQEDDE